MAVRSVRARVGKSVIRGPMTPASARKYTYQVRKQMESIERKLAAIIEKLRAQDLPDALIEALEPTYEKALDYTPVDTGRLLKSGYLEKAPEGRKRPRVELGFAKGGDPYYAVYVHELTQNYHRAPTRAKFLQSALEEDVGEFEERLVEALAKRGYSND